MIFLVLVTTLAGVSVPAQLKPIGDVDTLVQKEAEHVSFTTTGGPLVSVSFISGDVVRVRIAPSGEFEPDKSYAFDPQFKPSAVNARINERSDEIELISPDGIRVVIDCRPF